MSARRVDERIPPIRIGLRVNDFDRQPRPPIDALAAEIQLRYGRSRLTRTNIVRAEHRAVVMLMLVDALIVLYDLMQLRQFI